MATEDNNSDGQLRWYKDAIIYELHIKAFRDSNGDGIGDFKGLMEKLDYLQDLGATAIWLLPFYPSPLKDDGYDIADYYSINPSFGTVEEFRELLQEAHNRNLKVITELVINHTSDQHPWFQRARLAPQGSPERDYYVWTDNPEQYKDVRIIFQDFENSNWTWDPVAKQYYWHRFFSHQPDLNYDSPDVQEEVFRIIDFWAQLGVDGFRLDAIPYLFEREGTNGENLPETHAYLKKLRAYIDKKYPGTMLLAEANMWPEDSASYFGSGDECHMNFHFPLMPRMFMALQMEDRYPITDIFDQTPVIPDSCQWAIFLRNHDELTLEMVTDEERDYMYQVYVKDPRARINLGIRHRLAALMGNSRKKIELLNYLLFSLPGTPVIYYGDEIGMGDNFYLGDRNGVRTPMQWTPGRNAGFSEANPHKLYLPVILDPDYHYEAVNVEMQNHNMSSLLWWMKRLINKRKQYKALSRGDLKFVQCDNPKVLAFIRTYEEERLLVIVNLSRYVQPVNLELDEFVGYMPVEAFSKNKFPTVSDSGPYFMALSAYDCQWFELQQTQVSKSERKTLRRFELLAWDDLVRTKRLEVLETIILPDYMMRMRWFGGKGRITENIRIVDISVLPGDPNNIFILLIEVSYQSGLPETYQLPIALATDELATKLKDHCAQSVLATIVINGVEGVLYDAIYGLDFQQALIRGMASQSVINQKNGSVKFLGNAAVENYLRTTEKIKPRVLSAEQSNTSIIYDQQFFLKLFRKVDRAKNPDVEISHFLSEKAGFKSIPAYMGHVERQIGDSSIVLGMLQERVDSVSDGWRYVLDRFDDFKDRILVQKDLEVPVQTVGEFSNPVSFEEVPKEIKELMDTSLSERIALLGRRTGELHLALAGGKDPDFKPEPYSLHYQRSLFSGLQALTRTAFQSLSRVLPSLPDDVRREAEEVLAMKPLLLNVFKRIYQHKIDVVKIRIHGDYHLGQVMFTGKDFILTDFEGEPARSYSERRLKRSPLRDIAGMIRSLHYAAYASIFLDNQIRKEDHQRLIPFVEQWYHYASNFFIREYLDKVKGSTFIPTASEDLDIMLTTFLLEKAVYELNYELNNRPDWVIIPIRGIKALLEKHIEKPKPVTAETEIVEMH
jgi:maltose alpha-D-glucosyltransferase / alpha-amylase